MTACGHTTKVAGMAMTVTAAIIASALAAGTPTEARAARQHDHQSAAAAPKEAPGSTATTHDMMGMRQKMMSDNSAADARLQPLVEKMNAAKGEAKVDAMAAVVAELVRQRAAMRGQMDQMSQMTPEMMGMMMKDMKAEMRQMAEQCPMMKEMPSSPPKP